MKCDINYHKNPLIWVLGLTVLLFLLLSSARANADDIEQILPYLIQVESGGNPNAVSSAGAVGLCQIAPIVLEEYNMVTGGIHEMDSNAEICYDSRGNSQGIISTVTADYYRIAIQQDLFNEFYNKHIGEWYLRRLRDYYLRENYTIERMLAAYNGGITRLRRNNYDINKMPRETRNYVKRIMKLYKEDNK